jgi:Spy/CpxP family protein refolding chaperone
MKVRLFVGFSVVMVIIAGVGCYSAKAYQDPLPPPAEMQLGIVQNSPVPSSPTAPPQQPSLSEMIANLKELRKQEQQLTKAIQQKIQDQKKTLDDAEKELNSLGIESTNRPPEGVVVPRSIAPVPAPNFNPPVSMPTKKTTPAE